MRTLGLVLLVLGFAMLPASCFYLFGSTFASQGRTMLEKAPLTTGTSGAIRFAASPNKRYSVTVDFTFRPDGFPVADAAYVLDYDFPVTYTLHDETGRIVQKFDGAVHKGGPNVREYGTSVQVMGDVIVEHSFDWFSFPENHVLTAEMTVLDDRLGKVELHSLQLELWDDTVREARRGFLAVGCSALVFFTGLVLLIVGQVRTQSRSKRGTSR